jgi:hypothetical protein
MQIQYRHNGRSGGYGIAFENNAPPMGTSGKSIAARPKRILIGIIQSNSVKEKEGTIGMA